MSDNKNRGAFERRFSSRETVGRAISPSASIDEAGRSGILGLLNLLLQFASVVAGSYVALRYRFWSGAALVTAVQTLAPAAPPDLERPDAAAARPQNELRRTAAPTPAQRLVRSGCGSPCVGPHLEDMRLGLPRGFQCRYLVVSQHLS